MRCLFLLAAIFAATLHTSLAIVEVCTITAVELEATECGDQTLGVVCVADGCYRDKYGYEWMCRSDLLQTEGCWFGVSFAEPQPVVLMRVELSKGEKSIRAMKVYVDGEDHGWITTVDKTTVYHVFHFDTDDMREVSEVKLFTDDDESLDSMTRIIHKVQFYVN